MRHLTIATRLTIMAVLPLAILLGISLLAWTGLRTDIVQMYKEIHGWVGKHHRARALPRKGGPQGGPVRAVAEEAPELGGVE